MARFLAFSRGNQQIQDVNSTTGAVTNVGPAIGGLEVSSLWDNRCRSVVALFRGNVHLVGRTNANEIVIYQWDGSSMTLVFGPLSPSGGGLMVPAGLEVINDTIYALVHEAGGGSPRSLVVTSQDGVSWTPQPDVSTPIPASSTASDSVVWRRGVFVSTELGIAGFNPSLGRNGPYDDGDTNNLADPLTPYGSFGFWNNNLYFMVPDSGSGPLLFRLDPTWRVDVVNPVEWFEQSPTGLPNAGALANTLDRGNYCLFRSVADDLAAFYSGASGTVLTKTDSATYPAFVDLTNLLPANIAALTNAGISILEDDRRRTNQLQFFAVRDTSLGDTYILSWDGVGDMKQVVFLSSSALMYPNDQKADYRTFTDLKPAVEFDNSNPPTQPFPGRVVLTYIAKDTLSRQIGISPEYSEDGDEWFPMTEGEGSDGTDGLTSSPSGETHVFVWDSFNDLDGDKADLQMRIVARITGV